jgi:uncharacterized protein YcbX
VYPFKSLPGAEVPASALTPAGSLWRDREFALFDDAGVCINAKREPAIHLLRVTFDDALTRAEFSKAGADESFSFGFDDDPRALELWLAAYFQKPVALRRNAAGGFPDDPSAPGPTIVSTATLTAVASWFPELDAANVRARLRANIEIGGVAPFWEDRLFAAPGLTVPFRIGDAAFAGLNPCARCIVPSRDAESGVPIGTFAKRVAERRAATLPAWADRSRFDHFYRLAVNTQVPPGVEPETIRVGDAVHLDVIAGALASDAASIASP